jgi:hypothetical protein
MRNKIILLVAATAMLSCKKDITVEETTVEQAAPELNTIPEKQCFLKVQESTADAQGNVIRDSIMFEVERKGDSIYGKLDWKPQEKDRKLSTFTGLIKGTEAKAIAIAKGEGVTNKEELHFTLKGNTVSIKYGKMVKGNDDVYKYKDANATTVEVLQKIDCK